MDSSLTALGQLKRWSGVIVQGALFFQAIVFLRFAVAVFETIRAARSMLVLTLRWVRRWPNNVRGLLPRTNPLPGEVS